MKLSAVLWFKNFLKRGCAVPKEQLPVLSIPAAMATTTGRQLRGLKKGLNADHGKEHKPPHTPSWFPVWFQKSVNLICLLSETGLAFKSSDSTVWWMELAMIGCMWKALLCTTATYAYASYHSTHFLAAKPIPGSLLPFHPFCAPSLAPSPHFNDAAPLYYFTVM